MGRHAGLANALVNDPPVLQRYLEVAPIMAGAGWNHPLPLALPTGLVDRGTLVQFQNLTGLVAGETTLGDELSLLYAPASIARSALAKLAGWIWDGTRFSAPT